MPRLILLVVDLNNCDISNDLGQVSGMAASEGCVVPEQCSQGSRNVPNVPDVPNVPNVPNNVPNVPGHGGQDGLLAEGYVAKISILATYPVAKPRHHSKPKSKLTSPDFNMLTFGVLG